MKLELKSRVHDYLVRPETEVAERLAQGPTPAARYLSILTPGSSAEVQQSGLRQAEEGRSTKVPPSPIRPKRKRGQTTLSPSILAPPSISNSPVSANQANTSPPRPMTHRERSGRSHSVDFTRELTISKGNFSGWRAGAGEVVSSDEWDSGSSSGQVMDGAESAKAVIIDNPTTASEAYPASQTLRTPIQTGRTLAPMATPPCPHRAVASRYEESQQVGCFPRRHLLHNLHRFMKYSAAAYGVSSLLSRV